MDGLFYDLTENPERDEAEAGYEAHHDEVDAAIDEYNHGVDCNERVAED